MRFSFTFSALSPAGQAGKASLPKFTKFKVKLTFTGGKGFKTGGGVELAGLPAPPPSQTLHLPFHPSYLCTYQITLLEQ